MLQFSMRKNKGTHVLEPTKISTFETYIHDVSKYDRVVQQNIFVNGNLDVRLILKMMNTYL